MQSEADRQHQERSRRRFENESCEWQCSVPACGSVTTSKFFAHFAAVDDFDRAIAGSHQLLVGDDPHAVIDRGGPVLDGQRVLFGFAGRRVGGTVDDASA